MEELIHTRVVFILWDKRETALSAYLVFSVLAFTIITDRSYESTWEANLILITYAVHLADHCVDDDYVEKQPVAW